jgi:hypothetical protein
MAQPKGFAVDEAGQPPPDFRMRQMFRLLSIVAGLAVTAAPAFAQQFEGVVSLKLGGAAAAATVYAKGNRARYEMSAGPRQMVMLVDGTGTMTMLMPEQKMYMVMNLAEQAKKQAAPGTMEFKKTGKQGSYAGYACEMYTMTHPRGEYQSCITSQLGFLGADLTAGSGSGLISPDDVKRLRAQFPNGYFLLWMSSADGKVLFEVTKVEKTPVADDRLAVPAGFTEMKRPGQH